MSELILVRHGQSQWNLENRFTGWIDVDLTEQGVEEAKVAGQTIASWGLKFDEALTSTLRRANRTLELIMGSVGDLPVTKDWRLNERHYGALTGLNKAETVQKFGEDQVHTWRRSYSVAPPLMGEEHPQYAVLKAFADTFGIESPPWTESLKDCAARVEPVWTDVIKPKISNEKNLLVVAHGNSLRALIMMIEQLSPESIVSVELGTGSPLRYTFDGTGALTSSTRDLG